MADIIRKAAVSIVAALLVCSCDGALLIGGKTIGLSSGQFIYTNGFFIRAYRFPFQQVLHACEKTLRDMNATGLEKDIKISAGSMKAVVYGDKVTIRITYVSKEQTSVAVLVGMAGNNAASELIHEKITSNLQK